MAETSTKPSLLNRHTGTVGAALFLAVDLIAVELRRRRYAGDFDISMEFGRRFVSGQHLYQGGLHFPYLPSAAMFFSVFAIMPRPVAFLLFYSTAIICLWLAMRALAGIVTQARPALRQRSGVIAAITLILASHYIIRDLDDGGPNLILLALLTGGIYWAWIGRDLRAAGCLGAAVAFKVTAAIFIPFLLWKRRRRLAAYTTIATALWLALPILRMGPANWWMHQREWTISAIGFAAGFNQAAAYYYGAGNSGNQALRPALMYLIDSRVAALGAAVGLTAFFCWITRRPLGDRLNLRWLRESGGLLILAVLLAPIAWIQHLVLAIPALYLIVADWFAGEDFNPASKAAMLAYVLLALVLNRALMGKARYEVLLDWHLQTLCMLLILGVLMLRRHDGEAATMPIGDPTMTPSSKRATRAAGLFAAAALLVAASAWPQSKMQISSSAFASGAPIPPQYTCGGPDVSPPLAITGVPPSAKALALIVDDPDAPAGTFVHWVVYNLPPQTSRIDTGVKPGAAMPGGGEQGRNDFGRVGYGGPCPPPGPPHHYRFRLFALNSQIAPASPGGPEVEQAMQGHVLESAETTGTFGRGRARIGY
jgi:Raf kinase inhibitor-like YbhB/YbcL family protein